MTATINASTTAGVVITPDNSGALGLQTAGTTAVTIDTSQNVGIGTSSPVSKLNINGGAVTLAETTLGLYNIDFQSRTASTNARIQYDQVTNSTGQLLFYTNGGSLTERMRIDSSGNLLVGTTSANGTGVTIASPESGGLYITAGVTGTRNQIRFANPNGAIGSIQTTNSTTAYNTSSDYRLKENIAPMTGALAKVALLKPVTYKWKVDGSDGEGFIAHELQEVVPDCVTGDKDAVDADGNPVYQGIDTSFLVATLTAAIQELKAEVDALKAKVGE